MITARNYPAQLEFAARPVFPEVANLISRAQHFSLPDGGGVLDDDLRGIRGEDIRLPYPVITVSYFAPGDVSKRVILAYEDAEGIVVIWGGYFDSANAWAVSAVGGKLCQSEIWHPDGRLGIFSVIHPAVDGLPESDPLAFESLMSDLSGEIAVLLELLEALSCANVSSELVERIDPAINARRVRDGKLPLYESRQLLISVPGSRISTSEGDRKHRSPRQHLRRGHIRRLVDKKIWVNSHVVGNADRGLIDKSYALQRSPPLIKGG